MATARVFRSGNSQAVRLPKEFQVKSKELEIFRARLLAEEPPTLQEVGGRFGISRERVRQIESRLKRRLKEFLKGQAADIDHAEH